MTHGAESEEDNSLRTPSMIPPVVEMNKVVDYIVAQTESTILADIVDLNDLLKWFKQEPCFDDFKKIKHPFVQELVTMMSESFLGNEGEVYTFYRNAIYKKEKEWAKARKEQNPSIVQRIIRKLFNN
jgi:hypothetical protein